MRRAGGLWPEVSAFPSLVAAARRAARGKRDSASAARFLERVEPQALALQRELEAGTWRPSPAFTFEIHDPKRRTINAIPFRDQVVQHGLIGALEPHLERRMIADSFACRRGKGAHAALRRAQGLLRSHACFLKLDVASFFASVRHDVALETLERVVKDRRVLDLCGIILRGPLAEPRTGVGLPLGSLTSQWLANLVLDRLDHHVKEVLRVKGYLRCMDDFVLYADEPARLRAAHEQVAGYLREVLHLRLKERATILAPAAQGLPFLGWQIHRGMLRLRPQNLRRYRWRLSLRRWEYERGRRSERSFRQAVASTYELMRHGSTLGLRRAWLDRHALDL